MGITKHRAVPAATHSTAGKYRRRGSGYVYFLSTMMLVAVIGVSALMAARIRLRAAGGSNDATAARFYAQSAIELGLVMIQQDGAWRTSRGS